MKFLLHLISDLRLVAPAKLPGERRGKAQFRESFFVHKSNRFGEL